MPVHDWTRVEAGIFHAFHQNWMIEISRVLNAGILPAPYYALPEQMAAGLGPDVLTLEKQPDDDSKSAFDVDESNVSLLVAPPKVRLTAETDLDYYRRKQTYVAVRHVSGDSLVAVVEIVSSGNKSSRGALASFVEKAVEFLERQIHMLIVDLYPPTRRDPQGIHGAIWEDLTGTVYQMPDGEPLTQVAYESALSVRAHVEPLRVGGDLTSMPLFLEPHGYVLVPLEATYNTAFSMMPKRWRTVLE